MKPLRILMIAPTPYFSDRGCHVRIYEEARALQACGHVVKIVAYHLGRDHGDIPVARTPRIPWYNKLSAGPSWHKLYLDVLLLISALKVARQFKPDILHGHLHEGALVGFPLKKILRIPLIFDCQGSLCGELVDHDFVQKGSLPYRLFLTLEKWICRRADYIITSSTPTARLLQVDFQCPPGSVAAVCDGVDTETFHPDHDVSALRQELQLPLDRNIVVFLGAMNEYQGVDHLLEAIRLLQKRDDLHFLIMGYPENRYVEMAENMGIRQQVTFTGRIDYAQAPQYLCLGDIAVSPKVSMTEANGKLFNYMACGLPTVVFDMPVNREILGDLGVYASYGSVSSLAAGIELLADNCDQRAALSRRVRETAEALYSWRAVTEKIVEVYRTVVPSSVQKEP